MTTCEDAGRWIPISERLPDDHNDAYLLTVEMQGTRWVECVYYWGDDEFFNIDDAGYEYSATSERKAIAWMALPEPYREEEGCDDN